MKIQRFEEVIAWQRAQDLAVMVFQIFDDVDLTGLESNIRITSFRTSNSVAEGFGRSRSEFARSLKSAMGYNAKLGSMVYLAERLGIISEDELEVIHELQTEVAKLLYALHRSLVGKKKAKSNASTAAAKVEEDAPAEVEAAKAA